MPAPVLQRRLAGTLALSLVLVPAAAVRAESGKAAAPDTGIRIAPPNTGTRYGFEYFSADPSSKLLVPVKIWGEVRQPGIYYVPLGSSLSDAIGAAGGPLGTASMPDIELYRTGASQDVDLFRQGSVMPVAGNDTLIVSPSIRRDLPLIFSGISVLVSALTLYFVTQNRK